MLESWREQFTGYNSIVIPLSLWYFLVCGGGPLNLSFCVYQSVPSRFRLSLPCLQKRNIDVSSPSGCTELLGRGGRVCQSLPDHPVEG